MKILRVILSFAILIIGFSFVTNGASAQECSQITTAPSLYEVNRSSTKATIYFTPVNTTGNGKYIIGYGTNQDTEQNSVTISSGTSTGAVTYTINDLLPGVKYYFRVRASNDCSIGPWSAWAGDNLTPTPTKNLTMPATGSNTGPMLILITLGTIALGSTLFVVSSKKKT